MGEHFTHRIINLDTLIQDLRDLGISSGDTVFIKGNLGAIGLPREIDGDIRKVFFEAWPNREIPIHWAFRYN